MPLVVPEKAASANNEIVYLPEPQINPKDSKVDTFEMNSKSELLNLYTTLDRSWMLAFHLSKYTPQDSEHNKPSTLNSEVSMLSESMTML